LSRNSIVSVPHLEGPNFNVYVHFLLINKQLIGISFPK